MTHVNYKAMCEYIEDNVTVTGGQMFGLDNFVTGMQPGSSTALFMRDMCVGLDNEGVYSLYDYQGEYFDFIDDTQGQTLEQMLRSVISDLIKNGKLD